MRKFFKKGIKKGTREEKKEKKREEKGGNSNHFHVVCAILSWEQGIFSKENNPWELEKFFCQRGGKRGKWKEKKGKGEEKEEEKRENEKK